MRLSEERIQALAKTMAADMVARGAVETKVGERDLALLIASVIIKDMQVEEDIDREAREKLSRQRNLPPEKSVEYEAIFDRVKREVAARRGYPL